MTASSSGFLRVKFLKLSVGNFLAVKKILISFVYLYIRSSGVNVLISRTYDFACV